MPSVGIVVSRLYPGIDADSPEMHAKWRISHEIHSGWFSDLRPGSPSSTTSTSSSYPLVMYAGYEDPTLVIQMSPWACPSEQLEEFAQSEDMLDYLDEFGDTLDLAGAFHMNMTWDQVPSEFSFIALGRYWVEEADREAFEKMWKAFEPVMARVSGGRLSAGWRVKGGWKEVVQEDHGEIYAGLKGRKEAMVDYMEDEEDDDDEDGGLLEWVSLLGWKDEAAMNRIRDAEHKGMQDRGPEWDGLIPIVKLSKKMTNHYIKRIDYDKGTDREEKHGS